jgi:diguanylate cyclase (GGDEF)-like protein/PAS domain S-box-containing protein
MSIPNYISDFLLRDSDWKEAFEGAITCLDDGINAERLSDCLGILSVMLDEAPVGMVVVSPTDRILLINRATEQLLEYDRADDYDMTWAKMRMRKNLRAHDRRPLTEDIDPLYIAMRERRRNSASILVKSHDGEYEEWISITAFPIYGRTGFIIAVAAVLQDISDFMDMQDIMHDQAIHDPLTGLSNRSVFTANLAMAIARSRRNGSSGAVLVIDLDRFKKVNDVHGFIAGDDLLAKVARRLHAEVRDTDTVSRIGEDEFAIILSDIASPDILSIVAEIARRICASVGIVYRVIGQEVSVTASIGISIYPQDGSDDKTLISNAAEAMYYVKINGRNNFRFYHDLEKSTG